MILIKNQESFVIDELRIYPDDLISSSDYYQIEEGGSFENKLKIIKEKLII